MNKYGLNDLKNDLIKIKRKVLSRDLTMEQYSEIEDILFIKYAEDNFDFDYPKSKEAHLLIKLILRIYYSEMLGFDFHQERSFFKMAVTKMDADLGKLMNIFSEELKNADWKY